MSQASHGAGQAAGTAASAELTLDAPVKVNLHLGIHPGRDERGYHRADSVMIALAVGDRVCVALCAPGSQEAAEAAQAPGGVLLRMSEDVGVDPQHNTAWQAAARFREAFHVAAPVLVEVTKRVPPQSGLGGSSSDAASVLLALARLCGISGGEERLSAIARSIGADVPFFLDPRPTYLVGAGDVPRESFPELAGVPVVLVRPRAGVSTAAAYREFDARPSLPASPEPMLAALRDGDAMAVAAALHNNLEPAALRIVPECADVLAWLERRRGVLAAQVTGSGSCVFGICETRLAAARAAAAAQDEKEWWSCATFTVGKRAHFC
ncbi:MAG: 4-(cytidine 5'-diphospho)-2-C-methyl-D-erythritol kinase [Parafannyhessea sp.]|uniref:4-(cytidine 5'-diphospho)-2-C-methyl-D-erythritol kinase n=1 Tax=Parafannyhessea sp. TaxID=2847324 RepID=UPI003EFD9F21